MELTGRSRGGRESTRAVNRFKLPRLGHYSHDRPSVIIFTSLPPFCGLTKMVSDESPRLRFRMEEFGLIMSGPSLLHPCAFRFAASSAQAFCTLNPLLNCSCSTNEL